MTKTFNDALLYSFATPDPAAVIISLGKTVDELFV